MILSLDVGFRATGYAVIKRGKIIDVGVINTAPAKKKMRQSIDNAIRASQLAIALKEVCRKNQISAIIGELPSGGAKSARAIKQMAIALGVIVATASVLNLPMEWTDPISVKKAACGDKKADKEKVMAAISKKFDYDFPNKKKEFEHIADACGAYLALKQCALVKLFG